MRNEVKIGITALLVIGTGVVLYFVLTQNGGTAKPPLEQVSLRPEANAASSGGRLAEGRSTQVPVLAPLAVPASPAPAAEANHAADHAPALASLEARSAADQPGASGADKAPSTVSSEPKPEKPSGEVTVTPLRSEPNAAKPSDKGDDLIPMVTPLKTEPAKPKTVTPASPAAPAAPAKPSGSSVVEPLKPLSSEPPKAVFSSGTPAAGDANKSAGAEEPGKLFTASDGKQYYVVKQGDNGLWTIAEKVYGAGNGPRWEIIAKANPDADHKPLQPGQKLLIPAVAKVSENNPLVNVAGSASKPAASDAHGVYAVKAGDAGLEDIAKKVYQDGSLWKAIAKANPSVDTRRLRIGQELNIPPIADAKRMLGVSETATPSTATRPSSPAPSPAPHRPAAPPKEEPPPAPEGKVFD